MTIVNRTIQKENLICAYMDIAESAKRSKVSKGKFEISKKHILQQ